MIIKKANEIENKASEKCHDGEGVLYCKSLLDDFDKDKILFMHYDELKAGVSIGEHTHAIYSWMSEEIYFLISGSGTLIFDGKEYDMEPGDVSLCNGEHTHGFIAKTDCMLVVVGG